MGLKGIVFHAEALGTTDRTARDERVHELLEELPELVSVTIIGEPAEDASEYDVTIIDETSLGDSDGSDAFFVLETRLRADAASYLYIDPDKDRLKAAKKAGFLTHRLVSIELLDERLRHEKVLG